MKTFNIQSENKSRYCLFFSILILQILIQMPSGVSAQTIVKLKTGTNSKLSKLAEKSSPIFNEPWMQFQNITDQYVVVENSEMTEFKKQFSEKIESSYESPVYKLDGTINDSLYSEQWNLKAIQWDDDQINSQKPSSVLVAIVDSGIETDHEDLKGQLWINDEESGNKSGIYDTTKINKTDEDDNGLVDDIIGYNFLFNKKSSQPIDDNGHGTAVAGIINAKSNNLKGITGIASNAKMMILKAFDETGNGSEIEIAKALLYAWYRKADVVNMSFGINSVRSLLLEDIINAMSKDGIILVGSSGNSNNYDRHYPSAFESVISVGASSSYSDYASFSSYGNRVDLLAPGVEVPTTGIGNTYILFSGTSAAAPNVSGAIAIMKGIDNKLTSDKVRGILQETASKIRGESFSARTASGILNLKQALLKLSDNYEVKINSPQIDSWWSTDSLNISITTLSGNFKNWKLFYKKGLGYPDNWTEFASGTERKINSNAGTLIWNSIKSEFGNRDSVLSIRLRVENENGVAIEDRRTVFRYKEPLKIEFINIASGIEQLSSMVWMESRTNHPVKVSISVSQNGKSEYETSQSWKYNNYIKTPVLFSGEITAKITLEDLSGDKIIREKKIVIPEIVSLNQMQYDSLNIPMVVNGYILSQKLDFQNDGFTDLVVSKESEKQNYSSVYFYSGNDLNAPADSIIQTTVPIEIIKYNSKWYFLGVSSGKTFLYESENSNSYPTKLIWQSQTNEVFWGTKFYIKNGQMNVIWRNDNDYFISRFDFNSNQFVQIKKLAYPFNKIEGPARSKIVHYNNLNDDQVYFSDYNGNIYVYSTTISGDSTLVFATTLPLYNSSEYIETADLNNDGFDELMVLSNDIPGNDNIFDEPNPARWNLSVYSFLDGKDSLLYELWFTEFNGTFGIKNQIKAETIDNDHYLFLGLFPTEYILKWNNLTHTFSLISSFKNSSSSGIVSNSNFGTGGFDFVLNGTKHISGWRKTSLQNEEPEIVLFNQLTDSTGYFKLNKMFQTVSLYEKIDNNFILKNNFLTTDSVTIKKLNWQTDYEFLLTSRNFPHLSSNQINKKTVRFFKSGKDSAEFGNGVIVIKSENPIRLTQEDKSRFQWNGKNPNTLILSESKRELILSFESKEVGWFKIPDLTDINGRNIVNLTDSIFVKKFLAPKREFFISKYDLISEYEIIVSFSQQINVASFQNLNLQVFPSFDLKYEKSLDGNTIRIQNKNRPWGSLGGNITLQFSGLTSVNGDSLDQVGNQVSIERPSENISNVLVYPNPWNMGNDVTIKFGNLPRIVTIKIFNSEMRLQRTIKKDSFNGIEPFDGKNEKNETLGSGVYFYRIEEPNGNSKLGKFVIIR